MSLLVLDVEKVVVMYRNQFYYFSALLPESFHVAVDDVDILDILKAIIRHADASMTDVEASCTALGVLTSLPRSEWAVSLAGSMISHSILIRKLILFVSGCTSRTLQFP